MTDISFCNQILFIGVYVKIWNDRNNVIKNERYKKYIKIGGNTTQNFLILIYLQLLFVLVYIVVIQANNTINKQ